MIILCNKGNKKSNKIVKSILYFYVLKHKNKAYIINLEPIIFNCIIVYIISHFHNKSILHGLGY